MGPTDLERSAVELAYEHEKGVKAPFDQIPEAERDELLKQVRARELSVEQFVTHDMLVTAMGEGRRTPRRYMLTSFAIIAIGTVVVVLVVGVAYLLGYR